MLSGLVKYLRSSYFSRRFTHDHDYGSGNCCFPSPRKLSSKFGFHCLDDGDDLGSAILDAMLEIGIRQLGAGIQATSAPKIVHRWMNENVPWFASVLEENSRFWLRRSGSVAKSFILRSIVSRETIGFVQHRVRRQPSVLRCRLHPELKLCCFDISLVVKIPIKPLVRGRFQMGVGRFAVLQRPAPREVVVHIEDVSGIGRR
jgi:hypothetical protein